MTYLGSPFAPICPPVTQDQTLLYNKSADYRQHAHARRVGAMICSPKVSSAPRTTLRQRPYSRLLHNVVPLSVGEVSRTMPRPGPTPCSPNPSHGLPVPAGPGRLARPHTAGFPSAIYRRADSADGPFEGMWKDGACGNRSSSSGGGGSSRTWRVHRRHLRCFSSSEAERIKCLYTKTAYVNRTAPDHQDQSPPDTSTQRVGQNRANAKTRHVLKLHVRSSRRAALFCILLYMWSIKTSQ